MMLDIHSRRQKITETAQTILAQSPLYIDTETTGLDRSDEIVEVAVLDGTGAVLYESLVRPSQPIPPAATAIHQITNAMVAKSPSWPLIWPSLRPLLVGKPLVVYNAEFDLRMMQQSHARYRLPWKDSLNLIDLLKIYAEYRGDWDAYRRSYRYISLDNAGKQCGIPLPNSHRAADDARLARALLHFLAGHSNITNT
jgi:DNA polymerase III epsilon subunit-like protein